MSLKNFHFSLEQAKIVLESLNEAILLADLQGKIIYFNRALSRITGFLPQELQHANVFELLLPPNQHEYLKAKLANRARGIEEQYTIGFINKQGAYCWAEVKASPFRDEEGQVRGSITSITDVTEGYLAKVAREESEKRYLDLFENIYDPLFILDGTGQLQHINRAGIDALGYTMLLLPLPFKRLILLEDRGLFDQAFARLQAGEHINKLCLRMVSDKGNILYWEINSTPIFRNGKMEGSRNIARDLSEEKRFEWQQRTEEIAYKAVFENNVLPIGVSDANYKLVFVNVAFCKLFGYTEAEIIGKYISELTHPEDHRISSELFEKLKDNQLSNYGIEKRYIHKQGQFIEARAYVSAVFNADKELLYSVATLEDITEKKRNEQALIKAKQLAEQAHRAERLFLANMSHEIRTPMNAVIGMTHLLLNTNPTEEQLEYLQALQFSADSLIGIITNILDLSKIEANEIEFDYRPFSLRHLLFSLQKTFELRVRDKHIAVQIDIDQSIEKQLIGDQVRLNQILTNLLGNAAKFTQSGTIGIRVRLVEEKQNRLWIEFQVHDTGIGISQEHLTLIFQHFKQAESSTHRQFGGTGLGLSIVKQLVELQGGTIKVESQPQKGSVFQLLLPFGESELAEQQQPLLQEQERERDPNELQRLKGLQVLVAEDNLVNQKLISRILDSWSCSYTIAGNGLEFLEKSRELEYDIILMDVHMPLLDGCEATKILRKEQGNPNREKPIIALTAAALLDEKNRVFAAGMNEFLTKPFSPKLLCSMLLKYAPKQEPVKLLRMNLSYLEELSGGDRGFILEILNTFVDGLPRDIQNLEEAGQKKEQETLSKIAHRLKSSLQMLGLEEARQEAAGLEILCKKKTAQEADWALLLQSFLSTLRKSGELARKKIAELG